MNPKYSGPAILPPASEVRKRVEEHLESLPAWDPEPRERPESADPPPGPESPRKPGRAA
jgi:hypothetical protein